MLPTRSPQAACHNCRRQRLRCDRSFPRCLKCSRRGQECLGYQQLLRWDQGVASRGRMAGRSYSLPRRRVSNTRPEASLSTLTDPLTQDLSLDAKKYLFYFANYVCRDLVLYDNAQNRFRELIPLTHRHDVLLQIILANSALHMSNARQKSMINDAVLSRTERTNDREKSPGPFALTLEVSKPYCDALKAKQQALVLLKAALKDIKSTDLDVTLASVLFFIEFELIDSGRDDWKHHINGAKTIIGNLCDLGGSEILINPLRRFLISNILVFDVLGSTFTDFTRSGPRGISASGAVSLLQDEEGNHCSSFPVILLQLIRAAAQLSRQDNKSNGWTSSDVSKQEQALLLLRTAESFNPLTWATSVQKRSPTGDLKHRTQLAAAHQAGVCIYLSRTYLSLDPKVELSHDPQDLAADIVKHLSGISTADPLFTATAWPTFIAGAETKSGATQKWAAERFQELWKLEPWGCIIGAITELKGVWAESDMNRNWLMDLKGRNLHWLIS